MLRGIRSVICRSGLRGSLGKPLPNAWTKRSIRRKGVSHSSRALAVAKPDSIDDDASRPCRYRLVEFLNGGRRCVGPLGARVARRHHGDSGDVAPIRVGGTRSNMFVLAALRRTRLRGEGDVTRSGDVDVEDRARHGCEYDRARGRLGLRRRAPRQRDDPDVVAESAPRHGRPRHQAATG